MIYLINYDRITGALVSIQEFPDKDRDLASRAKLDLEISLLARDGAFEVVLLEAASREVLKKTHRRYFDTFEEMKSKPK